MDTESLTPLLKRNEGKKASGTRNAQRKKARHYAEQACVLEEGFGISDAPVPVFRSHKRFMNNFSMIAGRASSFPIEDPCGGGHGPSRVGTG